jgi:hypothetical protein
MCWLRGEYLLKESKGDTFASLDVTYTHISYVCKKSQISSAITFQ